MAILETVNYGIPFDTVLDLTIPQFEELYDMVAKLRKQGWAADLHRHHVAAQGGPKDIKAMSASLLDEVRPKKGGADLLAAFGNGF